MSMPLLTVDRLLAGYTKPVVGPLSFELQPGEVVGLWGANGCGKSTLLRAIAGQARVLGGSVMPGSETTLAWLPQAPVRLDELPMNGYDYLRYAQADPATVPKRIVPWLRQRVDLLSGGQFQLLAVWAVLAARANVVLLDEPTNNLDPKAEQALMEMLRECPAGRGVMLVSHERAFLQQACDRVIEMGH